MSLLKIGRNAEITLPRDLRHKLKVEEGDLLEAEIVAGGLLLRPVSVVERDDGWAAALEAMGATHYIGPEPEPIEEEVMDRVLEEVQATRNCPRNDR